MSTPATLPAKDATVERSGAGLAPDVAARTLSLALLLGIIGDALLNADGLGLAFPLWIALIATSVVALAWRAELLVPREAAAWLGVAFACACGIAWRASEILQFFDAVAAIGALVMAAAAIHRPGSVVLAPQLRETIRAFVSVCQRTAIGIVPLALREAPLQSPSAHLRTGIARFWRAAALATLMLVVFGALLLNADPIFASFVSLPSLDGGRIVQHAIITMVFTVILGGGLRAALLPKTIERSSTPLGVFQLDTTEITAALGALNLLFAASIAAQAGWVFGGEDFLRARTGLTVAEYARRGFFQMVWVAVLTVPVLVGTRAALAPGRALSRRHTALSLPIIAMLGVLIVSAVLRMKLYVHYFGLSTDRFYPLVFMGWLVVVLAWLALTVLRDWGRPFFAGVAVSALATLGTLNAISPDRVVARVNMNRPAMGTRDTARLDLDYLTSLGGEAIDLAVAAVVDLPNRPVVGAEGVTDIAARCGAANELLRRWGPLSTRRERRNADGAWRTWNSGEATALRVVAAHSGELWRLRQQCRRPSTPATQPTATTPATATPTAQR